MNGWKRIVQLILLAPLFILLFITVHEAGHTLFARVLGDPNAVFYLIRFGGGGRIVCLGCNIHDPSLLTPFGNLVVSLGGLIATQLVALAALGLLYRSRVEERSSLLGAIAVGFTLLDVPVQVIQGLAYDLDKNTFPTNVDLLDAMLLLQEAVGIPELVLKILLLVAALVYLTLVWRIYRSVRPERRVFHGHSG